MTSVRSGVVSTPTRLRGLPAEQACEALSISARIGDPEVFVLMGCLHLGKSHSLGVFRRAAIESRPSIAKPLEEAGFRPSDVTKSLLTSGFLLSGGLGRIALSPDGKIIEHRFTILADHLRLKGILPAFGSRPNNIPILREYMRRVCEGVKF